MLLTLGRGRSGSGIFIRPFCLCFVTTTSNAKQRFLGQRWLASSEKSKFLDRGGVDGDNDDDENDLYVLAASTPSAAVRLSLADTGCGGNTDALPIQSSAFATSYHTPVMWKECVEALLATEPTGLLRRQHQQQQHPESYNNPRPSLDDDDSINGCENTSTSRTTTMTMVAMDDDATGAIVRQAEPLSFSSSTALLPRSRVFIDGTLGGGGHSQALLEALHPGDVVFGCDVDPEALTVATERLSKYTAENTATTPHSSCYSNIRNGPWFVPVQSNFADLTAGLLWDHWRNLRSTTNETAAGQEENALKLLLRTNADDGGASGFAVDGILLDLGVSSYQIDTAERGFAFMKDGPLDMRMNGQRTGSVTAANLCNELDVFELKRIFSVYGDEPRARAIAESIVRERPLATTADLQAAVAAVTPQFARKGRRMGRMATMARVFQSLRIVVNQEDVVLERALTQMAPGLLKPGGRLVVLSYHSIEDRATKRVMRDGTVSKREANRNNEQKDMYGNYVGTPKPFQVVGKPRKATDEEVALNPRARSATLRIAERVLPPN